MSFSRANIAAGFRALHDFPLETSLLLAREPRDGAEESLARDFVYGFD